MPCIAHLPQPQVFVPFTRRHEYVKEFKQARGGVPRSLPACTPGRMFCCAMPARFDKACDSDQSLHSLGSSWQAHRRDDDIAIVNAGMRFRLEQAAGVIVCAAACRLRCCKLSYWQWVMGRGKQACTSGPRSTTFNELQMGRGR